MKNILTIYKFSLPFNESTFEKSQSESLVNEIEYLCRYIDIFESSELDIRNYNTIKTIKLLDGSQIKLSYANENLEQYYLPIFQFDYLINLAIDQNSLKQIIECFEGYNLKEYVVETDNNYSFDNLFDGFSILTELESDFYDEGKSIINKYFDFKKDNEEIYDESNIYFDKMFNYVLYMIYIYFQLTYFLMSSGSAHENLINLKSLKLPADYDGNIELFDYRLDKFKDMSESTIEQYGDYLNNFFNLFHKNKMYYRKS